MPYPIVGSEFVRDVRTVVSFMKRTGVRLRFFSLSLLFSFGLALFNLYTVSLLYPLVQGIIGGDFSHVRDLKLVGSVVSASPDFFSTSLRLFALLVVWVYLNIMLKNVLQYASSVSTGHQAKRATMNLRNMLFERCLSLGKSFYDRNKVSRIHGIVTRSSAVIEGHFRGMQNLIIDLLLVIVYVCLMLRLSWKLTLVSAIAFPLVNFLTTRVARKVRESMKRGDAVTARLDDRVFSILSCLPLVKGFVREDYERSRYEEANGREIEESYRRQRLSGLLGPIQNIGSTTGILFLAFGMAMVIYLDSGLDPTSAFVFFYLAQNLMGKLGIMNDFSLSVAKSGNAVAEMNDLLDGNDEHVVRHGDRAFPGLRETIELKNLCFSYDSSASRALDGVSAVIPKGKMTAIVGSTGSGKSTIASILLRFYDCPPGVVFIDGVDIREFDPKSLRGGISFVAQDSLLFADTIRHNIAYGTSGDVARSIADESRFMGVSERTAVSDFVERLPDKYGTMLGERGSNLSGGERQKVSIARALMRDTDILILDEATSALDSATEARVMEAVAEFFPGKTIIVISHRFSTIRKADHVILLERGRVVESGTLDGLIGQKGPFYRQWQAQTKGL